MSFICNRGLVHHKPSVNGESPSNNGFIYSAIAQIFGVLLDIEKIKVTFYECAESLFEGKILINRLPGKKEPPLSHDEILGMYLLGLINYNTLKANHFVFHGEGKPFTGMTFLRGLRGVLKLWALSWVLGESHRNHFWQFNVKEMNQIAFRLMPNFIYFLKVDNGIKPHREEKIAWKLYVKTTLESGSNGEKNILFALAFRIKDEKVLNKLDPKQHVVDYFGPGHIISEAVC